MVLAMRFCHLLLWSAACLSAADARWPTNGWTVSTPEAQGMDSAMLERADEFIRANSPNRYSFLVIRNGYLVFERYYGGASAWDRFPLASITKSFVSALTGIAVEQGLVQVDDRVVDVFPEYAGVGDPRLADLRVAHLLTMSGGLLYDEVGGTEAMAHTHNWVLWVLQQPMDSAPGERFRYSGGLTHLLSALLTRKTHTSTRDFGVRYLFGPLGIWDFTWQYDWQLYYIGGWGLDVMPRDLAKLGYLYLHDGKWEDRQVVPASWVRASTSPHIRHNSGADDFYGYLWWMDNRDGFFVPAAVGAGAQYIWYSRELNLVVVTTGAIPGTTGEAWGLMSDYVIPSVFQGPPRVNPEGVVDSAGGRRTIAPDSFVSLYGENLAPAEVFWDSLILDGKTLPSALGGISVRIAGRDCYPSYAGPNQVNVLAPPDLPAGEAEVEVRHPGGVTTAKVLVAPASPTLFNVATFAVEPGYVAEPGSIPGVLTRAARPGDDIALYANGLGATADTHPLGEALTRPYPHGDVSSVRVLFGSVEVVPQAVNMTFAGLWQVNVKVPEVEPGRVEVRVRVRAESSPPIVLPVTR
jgi:uncharacterized protein (TIGR03437 family)